MNRYESVLLDKMVDLERNRRSAIENNDINKYVNDIKALEDDILLLLRCIVEFRDPPTEEPVEDGFGALVSGGKEP